MTAYIIAMVILIAFSAYFSATETAFSSLSKTRIKTLADKGNKKAALVNSLSEQYDKLISTILIGNNIVNIASASLGTIMFVALLGGEVGATVSTVVLTVVVLIFGEITPKSIAKDCPEAFAMFSAPFMRLLMILFVPLTFIFSCWKKMVSKILHLSPDDKMSQEELLTFVDEVQLSGSIDEHEGELLHNAIEFSDNTAQDIMTHRVDIEAVPEDATKEEIAERFTESGFSRLLVYRGSIDNIIGFVSHKDFYVDMGITDRSVSEILTEAVFVTQKTAIRKVLELMKREKKHLAVVLDEYGGTFGIVTMEDILEELVGDILDEHDEENQLIRQTAEDKYEIDASIELYEFFKFFEISAEDATGPVSGWIATLLGEIPEKGVSFTEGKLKITVTDTEPSRVCAIEVEVLSPDEDGDGEPKDKENPAEITV